MTPHPTSPWVEQDAGATVLFRPVGQRELDLVANSGWTAFPPRLDWQPIFYPVLNEAYATQLAVEWNAKDAENGAVGYVTRFAVRDRFLAEYEVHQVGDAEHLEYWIPAEDLGVLNANIVGVIEVVSEWRRRPATTGQLKERQ